jgi:hypothetical protein
LKYHEAVSSDEDFENSDGSAYGQALAFGIKDDFHSKLLDHKSEHPKIYQQKFIEMQEKVESLLE